MAKKAWGLVLLMASVALAGCSDGGSAASDGDDLRIEAPPSEKGKGAIVGVVVDGAVQPVEGATVALQGEGEEQRTDEEGVFVFTNVEPGSYFLEVSKPGYGDVQQSVEVEADVESPPKVKVLLERIPGTEPFFAVDKWAGFIECSLRVGTGPAQQGSVGVNACNSMDNQDVNHPMPFEDTPDFFQSEMTWQSTQSLGSGLSLVLGPESCLDIKYARYDGPSPAVLALDRPEMAAEEVGVEQGMCLRVFNWVAEETADLFGLTVSQEFETISTSTYNFVPEEGWLYIEDGEPEAPQ